MRERPRKRIGHCFAAAGLFLLTLVSEMAQAAKVETVTFQTNIIPKTHEQPVKLIAKLYLPDKQSGPLSAVIISPSSGGIREEREVYYAEELVKAGIAALVIDSFSSRGLAKSTHDQSLLSPWESSNDAVAGLRWLIADGRFKADRIGVMGVSKGGLVAMYSALEIRRRWMRMTDVAFAAHIPIVPECIHVNRTLRTTGAPMFFMLAELDHSTLPGPCVEYAGKLREAGNARIEVKVYKGAHHAWEKLGPKPIFDPTQQNRTSCARFFVEDDGSFTGADGTRIPAFGMHEWQMKNCIRLGTYCCGGTPELKRQATNDLIAFLKRYGF